MTVSKTKKTPAKKPAAKKNANKQPRVEQPTQQLVQPLAKEALQMVLGIIDRSDVKGGDAGNIIMLKQELARAAGIKPQAPA